MKWSKEKLLIVLLFFFTLIFLKGSAFGDDSDLSEDLTGLSIEELMDVEVILTSKKPRKLSQAAAAIFVITGEDIRRSGVTSISEALRMVPELPGIVTFWILISSIALPWEAGRRWYGDWDTAITRTTSALLL